MIMFHFSPIYYKKAPNLEHEDEDTIADFASTTQKST